MAMAISLGFQGPLLPNTKSFDGSKGHKSMVGGWFEHTALAYSVWIAVQAGTWMIRTSRVTVDLILDIKSYISQSKQAHAYVTVPDELQITLKKHEYKLNRLWWFSSWPCVCSNEKCATCIERPGGNHSAVVDIWLNTTIFGHGDDIWSQCPNGTWLYIELCRTVHIDSKLREVDAVRRNVRNRRVPTLCSIKCLIASEKCSWNVHAWR